MQQSNLFDRIRPVVRDSFDYAIQQLQINLDIVLHHQAYDDAVSTKVEVQIKNFFNSYLNSSR